MHVAWCAGEVDGSFAVMECKPAADVAALTVAEGLAGPPGGGDYSLVLHAGDIRWAAVHCLTCQCCRENRPPSRLVTLLHCFPGGLQLRPRVLGPVGCLAAAAAGAGRPSAVHGEGEKQSAALSAARFPMCPPPVKQPSLHRKP